jgi:hypothetical protein
MIKTVVVPSVLAIAYAPTAPKGLDTGEGTPGRLRTVNHSSTYVDK